MLVGLQICRLSARRYHRLTTQSPAEVGLALGNTARVPKIDVVPLRIVRFAATALAEGIEERLIIVLCGYRFNV